MVFLVHCKLNEIPLVSSWIVLEVSFSPPHCQQDNDFDDIFQLHDDVLHEPPHGQEDFVSVHVGLDDDDEQVEHAQGLAEDGLECTNDVGHS